MALHSLLYLIVILNFLSTSLQVILHIMYNGLQSFIITILYMRIHNT